MSGPAVNDSLTFEGRMTSGPSKADLIVRDTPDVLVAAVRRKDKKSRWTIRGYDVYGDQLKFSGLGVEQAELASTFVELFDERELRLKSRYSTSRPVLGGIPVVVAADGQPAVAAWLRVRGWSREEITDVLDIGRPTVTEYLSRFRRRGTGIPDGIDLPSVGDRVETVSETFRHPEGSL